MPDTATAADHHDVAAERSSIAADRRAARRRYAGRRPGRRGAAAVALAALLATGLAESNVGGDHHVAPGETLSGLARRYGVSVAEIAAANGIADPNRIIAGTRLAIPVLGAGAPPAAAPASASAPASAPAAAPAAAPAPGFTHVVAAGENLSRIAARYGITVRALVEANGLANPNLIVVGRSLSVVGATTGPAVPSVTAPPFVPEPRRGHAPSFARWATAYGVDVELLMALAWQESGWQESVVSVAQATGVLQVTPATAQFVSMILLGEPAPLPLTDPDANIRMGARFLAYLLATFGGDERLALAAYNQGLTSVRRDGPQQAVLAFVDNVLAIRARL